MLGLGALLAGATFPLQAALNARVARQVMSSAWAATISGAVLTIVLLVICLVFVRPIPTVASLRELPWWAWGGGFCGIIFLVATTTLAPRLGVATMVAFVIAGQILAAVALEHFGGAGLEVKALDIQRLGAALLIMGAGVLLR